MGSCQSCYNISDVDIDDSISKEMQNYDFRIYPIPHSGIFEFPKGMKGNVIFVSVKKSV